MKLWQLSLTLFFTSIISSCITIPSDEIESQDSIYAHYFAEKTNGSNNIQAKTIFYEYKNGRIFQDHVALRGNSFIKFQDLPMIEIRNGWEQAKYEQNYNSRRPLDSRETVRFTYQNNAGDIFHNEFNFPSFPAIDRNSIIINTDRNNIYYQFSWGFFNTNRHRSKTSVKLDIRTNHTMYSIQLKTYNYKGVIPKSGRTGETILGFKICSELTQNAIGSSNKDRSTTTFCDRPVLVNQ